MKISAITPTGDRYIGLKRAYYYLKRMTIQPDEWIISDDSEEKQNLEELFPVSQRPFEIIHRHRPFSSNKAKSFTGNVLNCLAAVTGDYVFVIEDDDWYCPEYIEVYKKWLDQDYLLVGEDRAIYYNVSHRRYRVNGNADRASFCQTAWNAKANIKVKKLAEIKRDSAFLDARIWKYAKEHKWKRKLLTGKRLAIGIKGLPGRKGIGIGHRPKPQSTHSDKNWKILERYIGDDCEFYRQLMSGY